MPVEIPVIVKFDGERIGQLKQISQDVFIFLQSKVDDPVEQLAILASIKTSIATAYGIDVEFAGIPLRSRPVFPPSSGGTA